MSEYGLMVAFQDLPLVIVPDWKEERVGQQRGKLCKWKRDSDQTGRGISEGEMGYWNITLDCR